MNQIKLIKKAGFKYLFYLALLSCITVLISCSALSYRTVAPSEVIDDPEPNYNVTLNSDFQEYTSYMFIGNRMENFGTYFNTFFNAKENYDEAYDDYVLRVLPKYNEQIDSIYQMIPLGQESIDKFNKSIEKASKVLQFHKSSAFMDQAVLLIGKAYFYLGDYLKAERKFNEFISKLTASRYYEEALLYYAKTQYRLYNPDVATEKVELLIKNSTDKNIKAGAYQTLAEHYISQKDFESAIKNYQQSIQFSSDNEFKSQMQFLVASVIARTNPTRAASEFNKVLDYSTSYELEYFARYNYVKNLILSRNFNNVAKLIDQLEVDYKESTEFLGEIKLLSAIFYDQSNYAKAISEYSDVIKTYPKTAASSDACYLIGKRYEERGDYLNAYRYYRYSQEESSLGKYSKQGASKVNIYRKYYELKSKIAGTIINTEYDSVFLRSVQSEEQRLLEEQEREQENRGKGDDGTGRPGGIKGFYKLLDSTNSLSDTLTSLNDSVKTAIEKDEEIAKAQFELSELFVYELNKPDSAEFYLLSSFEKSHNDDFKGKVLFALASLYKNQGLSEKADGIYNRIIKEFPSTPVAEESRKQLGLSTTNQDFFADGEDSLFISAEYMLEHKEYRSALNIFNYIIEAYPASKYYSKSLYAIGWIYENAFNRNDSAYIFYSKLMEKEPNSEYSKVIGSKLLEYITNMTADSTSKTMDSTSSSGDPGLDKTTGDSTGVVPDTSTLKSEELPEQTDPNLLNKPDEQGDPTEETKKRKEE